VLRHASGTVERVNDGIDAALAQLSNDAGSEARSVETIASYSTAC
jgi:hypothetical protein